MFRTIGLVLTLSLMFSVPVAAGAGQTTTLADAGIVFGDCDTPDFEFSLSVPAELTGQPIGSDLAVPAGQSLSLVPVSLDALTSEESTIVMLDELALPVACGPIGGVPAPDGSIVIGIAPVDGSGVIGVAHLLPDGTDVIVSLFTTHLDAGVLDTTVTDVSDSGTNGAGTLDTIDTGSGVFSAAETAYATNLIFVMETMTASRDQANQLLDDPHPDEEQWNFDLILEVVTWGDLQDRLHELTPPLSFMEIHQLTVAAFALYDSAGDDLLRGIEANDSASLQSGFVKLDLADELIGDASELVNDLVDERQP